LRIAGQKFPKKIEGYLDIFAIRILEIQFIYSTISRRTLVGKRCPRSSIFAINNVTDTGMGFIEIVHEL
jgi:hypothetical protein